eukprot:827270_1
MKFYKHFAMIVLALLLVSSVTSCSKADAPQTKKRKLEQVENEKDDPSLKRRRLSPDSVADNDYSMGGSPAPSAPPFNKDAARMKRSGGSANSCDIDVSMGDEGYQIIKLDGDNSDLSQGSVDPRPSPAPSAPQFNENAAILMRSVGSTNGYGWQGSVDSHRSPAPSAPPVNKEAARMMRSGGSINGGSQQSEKASTGNKDV